jgi:hypothetical protein
VSEDSKLHHGTGGTRRTSQRRSEQVSKALFQADSQSSQSFSLIEHLGLSCLLAFVYELSVLFVFVYVLTFCEVPSTSKAEKELAT